MRARRRGLALALALLMLSGAALAEGASMTLPASLRVIGEKAFAGIAGFDALTLPDTVEAIGPRAFAGSTFTQVTLPGSLRDGCIDPDAFADSALTDVYAEEGTPAFRWAAASPYTLHGRNAEYTYSIFGGACTLEAYTGGGSAPVLPEGIGGCPVTQIGSRAFAGTGVTEITLPTSLREGGIAEDAFADCPLSLVRVVEDTPALAWAVGTPYIVQVLGREFDTTILKGACTIDAFVGDESAATVPEFLYGCPVEAIGPRAFSETDVTVVSLPASLREDGIAEDAFADCPLSLVRVVEDAPALAWAVGTPYTVQVLGREFDATILNGTCTIDAFVGDGTVATVPEGIGGCPVTQIGSRAFSGSGLEVIDIPATVTDIAEDALEGCAADLLVRAPADSAAVEYARRNDIDYQAEDTCYRALVIGQVYRERSWLTLNGTENDADAMKACLEAFPGTPFEVAREEDLTAQGILDAIAETFGAATDRDVSLLYYTGHGSEADDENHGALVGADGELVNVSALRAALDEIPGRKILIVDACMSGSMIPTSSIQSFGTIRPFSVSPAPTAVPMDPTAFAASFIEGFSTSASNGRRKAKGAASASANRYFVMTAAAADEYSYEDYFGSDTDTVSGLFTHTLAEGCGYDSVQKTSVERAADANGNGVLTFEETFRYAADGVAEIIQYWNDHPYPGDPEEGYIQTVQVSPVGCDWFGWLRS